MGATFWGGCLGGPKCLRAGVVLLVGVAGTQRVQDWCRPTGGLSQDPRSLSVVGPGGPSSILPVSSPWVAVGLGYFNATCPLVDGAVSLPTHLLGLRYSITGAWRLMDVPRFQG